jgi:hypothetical protein
VCQTDRGRTGRTPGIHTFGHLSNSRNPLVLDIYPSDPPRTSPHMSLRVPEFRPRLRSADRGAALLGGNHSIIQTDYLVTDFFAE